MTIFNIKKEKGQIVVKVNLPGLPTMARDAEKVRQVVREAHVREYLKSQGITVHKCLSGSTISNLSGAPAAGIFIFSTGAEVKKSQEKPLKTGSEVEKVIKDLTPASEPAIMEEKPKKRKRVKRDSTTGNQTTS